MSMEFKNKYDKAGLQQLGKSFNNLRLKHEKAKRQAAEIWAEVDYLRFTAIPDMMNEQDIQTVTIKGVGRLSLRMEAQCKTVDKQSLFEWLEEIDATELMSNTVNSSTLKAFILNRIREGEPIPDDGIIKFSTYEMATITKG